jgi:hypothetical protein
METQHLFFKGCVFICLGWPNIVKEKFIAGSKEIES